MCKILLLYILILLIIIFLLFLFKKNYKNHDEYKKYEQNNFQNYITINENKNNNQNEINNIIFLTKEELFNFLKLDIDNYYKSFTKKDLFVRNISNVNEYIDKIYNSVSEFNHSEKNILEKCINKISNNLDKINFDYFDGEKANNIVWKIGCIDGNEYENGLPHTRNDVIILNKNNLKKDSANDIISTLIHEKIHVYQKMYPDDINNYLEKNNFQKINERIEINNNSNNSEYIRANPDLDKWVYKDDNKIYKAIYEPNAKTVSDVQYSSNDGQKSEHPFEKMAIEIEDYYTSQF